MPPAARSACVIRQGAYPFDPRVRREVAALVSAGFRVDVICLRGDGEALREQAPGVTIHRLPLRFRRGGVFRYLAQYLVFMVGAGLVAGVLAARRRPTLVQVHTLPDTLVFAALVPKLLGARVILDLHETMVEFFATKFPGRATPRVLRLVAAAEQASIRFADHAITCTDDMREAFVARGARPEGIGVVHNSTEEDVFDPRGHPPAPRGDGAFRLICHGSVEERYGIDTAIRAVRLLRDELPDLRLDIYGEGAFADEARQLAQDLGVTDRVWFSDGWVPLADLVQAIARADAGVVAMKRDAFRDLTHCNKMYDYIAMGIPVLASRTRSVRRSFGEDCFAYFASNDPADFARAVRELHASRPLRRRLVARAAEAVEPLRWPAQRSVYLEQVERTVGVAP